MELKNYTPFAGMAWESWDCNGAIFVTSLLRLKFKLVKTKIEKEWRLQLLEEQGDLFGADEFYDEEKKENVKYESDYVPFKPCADLVVNATAQVPYNNVVNIPITGYPLNKNNIESQNLKVLEMKLHECNQN